MLSKCQNAHQVLLNLIYRFNAIQQDILLILTIDSKVYMVRQKTRVAYTVLKEKTNFGGLTLPGVKIYYKATVLKTTLN